MSAINETLIRDVVAEVLGRLGQAPAAKAAPSPSAPKEAPASGGNGHTTAVTIGRGKHGVFQDANEACAAAHSGFLQLKQKGVAARAKVVEIVKALAEANAAEWGKIELEETKIGRLDHKIEKLKIIKLVPGVEWLHPDARSGDHGGERAVCSSPSRGVFSGTESEVCEPPVLGRGSWRGYRGNPSAASRLGFAGDADLAIRL